jgi:predicted regulator of Ras-like GTPase activity (Roadblock/LC7/MglB family)
LFSQVISLLEASTLAKRLDASQRIWMVSSSWWRGKASDQLLAAVLSAVMAEGRSVFLAADEINPDELSEAAWSKESDHLWRVPADFDPKSFLESSLHNEGNYGLFACASKANVERIPHLPWWGPSNSGAKAAKIAEGLRNRN